jgi:hypothetical protein
MHIPFAVINPVAEGLCLFCALFILELECSAIYLVSRAGVFVMENQVGSQILNFLNSVALVRSELYRPSDRRCWRSSADFCG